MNVALVLGGGGAKAMAAVGAWRALEQAGVRPAHILGTSMGAVVGAALAAGATYEHLLDAAKTLRRRDVAPLDPLSLVKGMFATGLLKPDALRGAIGRLVPAEWFDDLTIPLTVTATDLDSGELVLFGSQGLAVPLRQALYASCALPVYYPPARIGGRRYGDGGLRAVLPLAAARDTGCDVVVAVHTGPGFDEEPPRRRAAIPALVRAHGEALRVMMAAQVERDLAAWPANGAKLVLVRPVKERESTFAVGQAARYVEAGHAATARALREAGVGRR